MYQKSSRVLTDGRFMFYQKKPTCTIYVSRRRQKQSFGDQDLIKFLNLVNDSQFFIRSGARFHILGTKYLID